MTRLFVFGRRLRVALWGEVGSVLGRRRGRWRGMVVGLAWWVVCEGFV
jgi:hypothetical protein